MSTPFFSGVTANQAAVLSRPFNTPGDCEASFYASGPLSGTWGAKVRFWEQRGDGGLALVASAVLTQAGPNVDGTGTLAYDSLDLNVNGGSQFFADVTAVTGTIPAPGLYAEGR
jgi:hypothetical protein